MPTSPDPIAALGGIENYGAALRRGETTVTLTTRTYLDRIAAYDGFLGAYQFSSEEHSMETAAALDSLLAAGTDLGPLMGVPIAIKDIFAVNGMPTTAGSLVDVSDIIGEEGRFVGTLRNAGCVILGKTKTVEFAFGGHGTNQVMGTPVNPWDHITPRLPGGSSSGSAVAMAAGLCGFAIGSDTGGSVRGPAAWCGVFGLKTSVGLWPTDGIFPLSRLLDSIGPLTRTAADAAVVFATLVDGEAPCPARLNGLRLGKPVRTYFDDMEPAVAARVDDIIAQLITAGVTLIDAETPNCNEILSVATIMRAPELLASLGRDRFLANRDRMDANVAERTAAGLNTTADSWIQAKEAQDRLRTEAENSMEDLDAWVMPTRQMLAPTIAECADNAGYNRLAAIISRNTRGTNVLGQCGAAIPIHGPGDALPVSLQILCNHGDDKKALAIALAIEELIGEAPTADLSGFS
jgi:aspartyl-tRNA(Asn)/glutamyl-tRNA(Gln) amidotransferase subunit A